MRRWVAYASIAALFACGIAIGALGTIVLEGRRGASLVPGGLAADPEDVARDLERMLGLSPQQRDAATAILTEGWREGERIRRELRPQVERPVAEVERRFLAALDPGQRERYEALVRAGQLHPAWIFLGPRSTQDSPLR